MQVSAFGFAQKINLSKSNASLKSILREIEAQSDYNFLYIDNVLKNAKPVSIRVKDTDILVVLKEVFKNQPLIYEIDNKSVVLKLKQKSFLEEAKSIFADAFSTIDVRGRVLDENNKPLVGAVVKVKGTKKTTLTDNNGEFTLKGVDDNAILIISFLGYETIEIKSAESSNSIKLVQSNDKLNEVEIVSTGYQNIPKERATGSFALVDSALLNRSVGTGILGRLDGVTSSLSFNKNITGGTGFNASSISIRGRSTIMGDPNPLIVVDNFPYNGDINSINPNDVESVTVLRDAAAASIWGTRAGNGVIVIATKRGKFNQNTQISLNSTVTIGQKPKLYSVPQLTSKEYIETEKYLFGQNKYNSVINNGYGALSPAVEILLMRRQNLINDERLNSMLDSLGNYDIREDQLKYLYRIPFNQQYQVDISGGTANQRYFLSGGYDRNLPVENTDSYERFTINANNTYRFVKNKLELNTIIQFSTDKTIGQRLVRTALFPYENIADFNGAPLAITDGILRLSYIEAQQTKGLLDWHYRPLDENVPTTFNSVTTFRINNTLTYNLINSIKLSAYHSYQKGIIDEDKMYDKDSYYTRNQINSVSSITAGNGLITKPIATGSILQNTHTLSTSNYGRLQVAFDKKISEHTINSIIGYEISNTSSNLDGNILYGYNPEIGTNSNSTMDFSKNYTNYYSGGGIKIPTGIRTNGTIDRYRSYYANLSYSYLSRYIISGSARKDESNIFGVKSNQKGVPLWSAGMSWDISKESFYKFDLIPYLRLRTTYGYNGNVDKSTSAYLTAGSNGINLYNALNSSITNPPNPSLRWEKVRNINLAVDFSGFHNRVVGSIEVYQKKGLDLIGTSPIAPQTGITQFKGNSANLLTKGLDITLNLKNIDRTFKWNTFIIASFVRDKVTNYLATPGSNLDVANGNYNNPLVGYPYNSLFSFKWAGLDNTGSPQGYLGGVISKNYNAIANSLDRESIVFNGSRSPTFFGSMINSFNWKQVSLSFNIVYKAGYYLRRNSLSNSSLYNGAYLMSDYGKRWQTPGDELVTNVPSLLYPINVSRDSFYSNSEVLVFKGDHIRLQDIRLSYDLTGAGLKKSPFKSMSVFAYANNLGMLWKKNTYDIDPDSPNIHQGTTISFGLRTQF